MNRLCAALLGLLLASAAQAQQVVNPQPNAGAYGAYNAVAPTCVTGTGCWLQTDINGQLKITGTVTFTPSGTQNVNLTQILGAAPSLTNPLWVFPATGATFPVSVAAAPLNTIGITPTDRTVASATGASQTMMAANASRHSLSIVNTGNANCGVNPTGGTAVIGGAGTLTISPFGAYTPRIPTLSAVTVICTAAQPIYGDEN